MTNNKKKIFGTDGIRSRANAEFMNPLFFNKLAIAINKVIFKNNLDIKRRIIIAKDTRRSGYMIESALSSAFMALGVHVILTGPIPTAVLPFLMSERSADLGFNISASHNPFNDNGIKIFAQNGSKLSDETELEIEKILLDESEFKYENLAYSFIDSKKIGYLSRIHNACEIYTKHIIKITENEDIDLHDLKIVVDCANGAAYKIASMILFALGVLPENLIFINNKPDGFNINYKCGAVHPEALCKEVKKFGAHLGIALDGDADRVIMCDENGNLIENDQLIALCAKIYNENGKLKNNTLVVNVTSNYGIEKYLKEHGIDVHRVDVGDKYIIDAFEKYDYNFGGERSGHIIFGDFMKAGDGLLSGILMCSAIKKYFMKINCVQKFDASKFKISQMLKDIKLFMQVSKNFDYSDQKSFDSEILNNLEILEAIKNYEKIIDEKFAGKGRLLIRKSGTEQKIRLIAEGEGQSEDFISGILDEIVHFFKNFSNAN